MYKKEGCPYCKKAKELLEEKYKLDITFVDIEEPRGQEEGSEAKRAEKLYQMRTFSGGRNTVPQIFFNSEHLGGNDDVQTLEAEGKLQAKVDKVLSTEVSYLTPEMYHPWY